MVSLEIWVVDDIKSDINDLKLAAKGLHGYKLKFRSFTTTNSFLTALKNSPVPDMVLLDIQLKSKLSGFDLCSEIKKTHPLVTVCMFSRFMDAEHLKLASLMGASAFISKQKPIEIQLLELLKSHLGNQPKPPERASFSALESAGIPILGQSTKKILQSILQVIREDLTLGILLTGSSGTGKTYVLQALIQLLGASFKKNLIISPLSKKSLSELSLQGDSWLLIDELQTFSVVEQDALYRTISALKTQRRPRILATTRLGLQDLREAAATGKVSSKLLAYLAAEHIQVPDLANRREEIPVFFNHFLERLKNGPFMVSPEASARVASASFTSGHVRELKETVELMGSNARSGKITLESLPSSLIATGGLQTHPVSIHLSAATPNYQILSGYLLLELVRLVANQDRNYGRRTTFRSLERCLDISRTAISERLRTLQDSGIVTLDELTAIFGDKYGRSNE